MSYTALSTSDAESECDHGTHENMRLQVIEHQGQKYPQFQTQGNAAQFIMPVAHQVLKGVGYDIGYAKSQWKFPPAIGIDMNDSKDAFHADHLPPDTVDYIFSSHCLEHVPNYASTLDYWMRHLKPGGVLLLYLPDFSQTYWRPWHNRKHIHAFVPAILKAYFVQRDDVCDLFVSGVDLNSSFSVLVSKKLVNFPSRSSSAPLDHA